MSAILTLCGPEHLARLAPLVGDFHAHMGIASDEATRHAALGPLLDGIPHGTAYLIGPPRAPIGYIILSFGWSVEFGGLEGTVDELYIRPAVRGRGIATEVMLALPKALAGVGLKALSLEVATGDETAQRLYARAGFSLREGYHLMSRAF